MATLRHYVDGGVYILRGYPIRSRNEDMFCTTIQVLPRAERFFAEAGYRDEQTIPREVFYALLLDGDLSSPAIEANLPTVENIHSRTIHMAEGLADSQEFISLLRQPSIIACKYLLDYYKELRRRLPTADASLAAYLCLVRHVRQATYDRDVASRRNVQ